MSENISNSLGSNILVVMPYIIYIASFFASIVTTNYELFYFFLYVIIFGDGLNAITKILFKKSKLIPNYLGMRPSGCGGSKVYDLCRGCGIFPKYSSKTGSSTFGFPSGHAQITSLTATFWIIYIIKNNKRKFTTKHYISICLIILIYLLVCFQRIKSKCHNMFQIIGGTIYGVIIGILGYHLCHKIAPKTYP